MDWSGAVTEVVAAVATKGEPNYSATAISCPGEPAWQVGDSSYSFAWRLLRRDCLRSAPCSEALPASLGPAEAVVTID